MPRLDARVLLGAAMQASQEDLLAARNMTQEQLTRFEALVARREQREPLAYIVGSKEFWSLDFEVGPGVLVPRPETETLIEEALRDHPDRYAPLVVADFGTGSGCLLVAFLSNYPNAKGWVSTAPPKRSSWARRNVVRHGLGLGAFCRRPTGPNVTPTFDIVFANPPYVTEREFAAASPEIVRYEPRVALVGGDDGLKAYRELAPVDSPAFRARWPGLSRNRLPAGRFRSNRAGTGRSQGSFGLQRTWPGIPAAWWSAQKTVGKPM
jgi:release factor glutamine methyltransferase